MTCLYPCCAITRGYQAWRNEISALFATRNTWKNLIDKITEKPAVSRPRNESAPPAACLQPSDAAPASRL
jgi:hypothetical protein